MSFEFKCPNCDYLITEKDFKENEKVLSHLNETFKQHKTEYVQVLRTKMEEHYKKEQQDKIQLALVERENQLNKSFQTRIDDLNKTISDYQINISNNKSILEKSLIEKELEIIKKKNQEIEVLKMQINELKEANMQFKVIQNKTKGENFEHEVEAELRKVFEPDDVISKITSQDKKADYLHRIRQDNTVIGKIVYEVKNAEWSNNWERKLVDDMAKQNSKYGVLIATSFNNKYPGIPFKRSDYNPNIYLCDSESFYFVGQILKTIIKMEYRLESNRNQKDYNEKIKQFNEWKATQLPKLHTDIINNLDNIEKFVKLITDRAEDIRKEKQKIYKNWVDKIKSFLENFIF